MRLIIYLSLLFLLVIFTRVNNADPEVVKCDVVIAGGSTAAFAAAIASAAEGANTCLLEPTDWVGGQMTASGVSAIDFAWHTLEDPVTHFKLDVAEIDREKVNQGQNFWTALTLNETGNCWVSPVCFLPLNILSQGFAKLIAAVEDNLHIYYQTVVKSVGTEGRMITNITAIQRKPQPSLQCNGYDIFPSLDLPDWYSFEDSERWQKTSFVFTGPIFLDTTDWGELLPLTNASYLQGIDEEYDGDTRGTYGSDTCGQAMTYSFMEMYHSTPTPEPPNPWKVDYPEHYVDGYANSWNKTWTYRRSYSHSSAIEPNDITLQNCNGNDFVYGYIFQPKQDAAATVSDWMGGVNLTSMNAAERMAIGWHYYYKSQNETLKNYITLDSEEFGTCHGLAKMPYLRDSRRSVGLDNFVIMIGNITGNATDMVGYAWEDRVAIGSYDVDIHKDVNCDYPSYMDDFTKYGVLPYFIPFRALTNQDYDNLLVAGKTMAMSFLSNAAIRLHPIEWASGSAAGASAAYMAHNGISTTRDALANITKIQERTSIYTPMNWNINGKIYPQNKN